MGTLNRRLEALERAFGPVIVESPAPAAAPEPRFTPHDQLQLSYYGRLRVQQIENIIAVDPSAAELYRVEVARIKAAAVDLCDSCGRWPMAGIRVDHDGAVRCRDCNTLHSWLPPRDCRYFGHPRGCSCGYSYEEELTTRWIFWPLLEQQAQQILLSWAGVEQ